MPDEEIRHIFICHAGEDEDAIAGPLAGYLRDQGWQVWFDEFEIQLGDDIRTKIDEGRRIAQYGAIILSKAFFQRKPWPESEYSAPVTRENNTAWSLERVVQTRHWSPPKEAPCLTPSCSPPLPPPRSP